MKRIFFLLSIFSTAFLAADDHMDIVIKKLEKYAEEQRKVWEIPGLAIGIVKGDKVILSKGYGQRGLKDSRPVDENTLFQIGSLSKSFTSALVAIGDDKGWLKWNDKVLTHLPTFQLADPWVTREFEIVDLLAQRSGLPAYGGDTQAIVGYTPAEILEHLHFIQPVTSFRSTFAYLNVFFVVASEVLKLKTGLSYQDLLKRELFEPLGLKETTATLEDYLKAQNSAEWLIRQSDGKVTVLSRDYPERNWNYVLGAAGGINSTVKDMTKWVMLQANNGKMNGKQIISKKNVQQMHRPYIYMEYQEGLTNYYALGWIHMAYSPYPIIWHNGATMGVYNVAAMIPQEQLGIVILSNVRDTQLATALMLKFFDLYYDKKETDWSQKFLTMVQEKEKQYKEKSKKPIDKFPEMPLENYAGKYHNPIFGDVNVEIGPEALFLTIGKIGTKWTLEHWSRDIFTLNWPRMDESGSKVYFYSDGENLITKMNIELLSKEGDGVFEKVLPQPK